MQECTYSVSALGCMYKSFFDPIKYNLCGIIFQWKGWLLLLLLLLLL